MSKMERVLVAVRLTAYLVGGGIFVWRSFLGITTETPSVLPVLMGMMLVFLLLLTEVARVAER